MPRPIEIMYSIGQEIPMDKHGGQTAVVTQILISEGSYIQYMLSWWRDDCYTCRWLSELELSRMGARAAPRVVVSGEGGA